MSIKLERPKVSVIVPIYKVEKYIERCARSLFEQTLDNIEFVFVDDCTPDYSIEILTAIIREYDNRIIEKNWDVKLEKMPFNSGLPAVRRYGVNIAKGEYIIHCDSDDWVNTDMYRAMYEKAKEEDADVVLCDFIVHDGNHIIKEVGGCHDTNVNKFIVNLLCQKDPWSLWNKMFHRDVYSNNLIFPKGNMGEDMVVTSQLILNCKKATYIPCPYYFYFYNQDSITRKLTIQSVVSNFIAIKNNVDIVLKCYKNIDNRRIASGLLFIQYNAKAHLFPVLHKKECRDLFKRTYPNLFKSMILDYRFPRICIMKYVISFLCLYPRKINE